MTRDEEVFRERLSQCEDEHERQSLLRDIYRETYEQEVGNYRDYERGQRTLEQSQTLRDAVLDMRRMTTRELKRTEEGREFLFKVAPDIQNEIYGRDEQERALRKAQTAPSSPDEQEQEREREREERERTQER